MAGRNGDGTFLLGTVYFNGGAQGEFAVRCGDFQPAILEDKQEVFQDGKRRLGRNGLGYIHEGLQEIGAGNGQIHIAYFFNRHYVLAHKYNQFLSNGITFE